MPRLPPLPDLEWREDGHARSRAFGDVYFSAEGGLAEAEAVFLTGAGLPEAWAGRDRFALCELGFGSGLNLLAVWRAWCAARKPHAQLHISSIEAFPLAKRDAARILARFPEVADLAEQLLKAWPVRAYGPQRLWFPGDGLSLTLFSGDAETILAGFPQGQFEAWLLDGFAPSRNPAMWSPAVFTHIARLSAPGARVATFSVAGEVRRGLEAAGFQVEKRRGFAAKRERLEGCLRVPAATALRGALYPYDACHPKRVAVIGAGIAGAATAHALAQRGVEAIVLEAAPELGAGASGNPVGLVMPRLDRGGVLAPFFLAAYLHAVACYEKLGVFASRGVEQHALAGGEAALADLLHDPPLPEDWLSALPRGAAFHPRAGLIEPLAAMMRMFADATLMRDAPVGSLDTADGGWIVRAPDGRALLKADAVVLACGAALKQFAPASFLPITLSRGQIEWGQGPIPAHAMACGSYVAPFDGGVLFGATFDPIAGGDDEALIADARARNVKALTALAPEIAAQIDPARLMSRVSFRATTPDRAPIAGLLPDAEAWMAQYAGLAHGRVPTAGAPPAAHRGVYVIGGLGARGLTLAPLLGEVIAGEMCGEPPLLTEGARNALHPARFLHRALKRR